MANSMPSTKPKTKASNEPYRKVKITMWDDPKFCALSPLPPSGQSLFIYLLTSPFTGIIPGLFKAGRAALAEELGWEQEAFDLALGEGLSLGMVKADLKARVFWLPRAAAHNPPASVNVIKSWARAFELLPECDLKWEAWESLRAACYGVSEAMGKAFDMAMPLPKDKPKPLPSGIQKAVNSKQILKDPPLYPPKGKRDKNTFDPLGAELPDWLPEELWREWVEYRKQLKKPIKTQQGVAGTLKKLSGFREQGYSPESVIREAMANEWQGLYEPKNAQVKNGQNIPGTDGSAAARAVRLERERVECQQAGHGRTERMETMGNPCGDIRQPMADEEWIAAVNAMDSSNFGYDR